MISSSLLHHGVVPHQHHKVIQQLPIHRLGQNLVHAGVDRPIHVLLLRVPRHSRYNRLRQVLRLQELADFLSGLVPIHDWHLTVHKDQIEGTLLPAVLLDVIDHGVERLLPGQGMLTPGIGVNVKLELQENVYGIDVEDLIIHDQDLLGNLLLGWDHLNRYGLLVAHPRQG